MRFNAHTTDAELFNLIREGNMDAYTQLYYRYERLLFLHAHKFLDNSEEVRDIIQELFMTLWERRSELTFTTNIRSYLYVAVRNRIFDYIARQKSASQYLESLDKFSQIGEIHSDEIVRYKEMVEMIEKEIAALPTKMRKIFELSRFEHLSHKEIADRLNLSELTVKTQIKNALKVLKGKLGALILFLF